MRFTDGTFGPGTLAQAIAMLELEFACDRISKKLDKANKGIFGGPYEYPSKEEAEAVHGAFQWVNKAASRGRTGINRMFNHGPEFWGYKSGNLIVRVPAVVLHA